MIPTINENFQGHTIIHADTLSALKMFPDKLFGGVLCDPPYASGAADQNGKQKSTSQKYTTVKSGTALPDFEGDSKDRATRS